MSTHSDQVDLALVRDPSKSAVAQSLGRRFRGQAQSAPLVMESGSMTTLRDIEKHVLDDAVELIAFCSFTRPIGMCLHQTMTRFPETRLRRLFR